MSEPVPIAVIAACVLLFVLCVWGLLEADKEQRRIERWRRRMEARCERHEYFNGVCVNCGRESPSDE